MKILYILHENSIHNGSWRAAYGVLRGLRERGVDVLVACPGKDGAYEVLKKEGFKVTGYKYIWYSKKSHYTFRQRIELIPRAIRRYLLNWRWMGKMKKVCEIYKPDIIHSNSSVITNGYKIAKSMKIPHVWHVREYGDLDFDITIKEADSLLQKNKYSVNVTKGIRSYRHNDIDEKYNIVVYDGVYPESYVKGIAPKEKYFLFVGSLNEGKGIGDLLESWKSASSCKVLADYKLIVCGGKSDELSTWKKFSNANQIFNVEWLGRRNDVDKFMMHASAVIVPSFFEAFGFVMPEAIANGALVIGRNTAGTKEQFDNGVKYCNHEIGLRFETKEQLTQLLLEVATHPSDYYDSYIKAGQNVFKKLYTTEVNVTQLISFYEEILKEK